MKNLKSIFSPLLLIAIALVAFTSCEKDDDPVTPTVTANFTYSVNAETGAVNFTNTSSNADSYVWNFGDGNSSTDKNPSHIYEAGMYMVTLTASNVAGDSDAFMDEITIGEIVEPINNLITNGDFESGATGWIGNAVNVQTDNGNAFNFANVASGGNAYDVNLSYVLEITQGKTYKLTFDASSDINRTMLAGIGLNEAPYTNTTQTVSLTPSIQTFTYEFTATEFGGANSRIIFDMGADIGVVVIDNVILEETEPSNTGGSGGTGTAGDELVANGNFDGGTTGWIGNALDVRTEGGNSYNFANVAMAGNPYDVNLSYVLEITQGKTYRLTFDASSDGNRTILAGIGLNQDPWTNVTETVNLSTSNQTFTYDFTATDFGAANSRVIFDMGADTGVVVIDNVSLVEVQ